MSEQANLIEVTEQQFYAALYADQRDIMPRLDSRTHTDWETRHRSLFGRTFPGWANPGDQKRYLLAKASA